MMKKMYHSCQCLFIDLRFYFSIEKRNIEWKRPSYGNMHRHRFFMLQRRRSMEIGDALSAVESFRCILSECNENCTQLPAAMKLNGYTKRRFLTHKYLPTKLTHRKLLILLLLLLLPLLLPKIQNISERMRLEWLTWRWTASSRMTTEMSIGISFAMQIVIDLSFEPDADEICDKNWPLRNANIDFCQMFSQ